MGGIFVSHRVNVRILAAVSAVALWATACVKDNNTTAPVIAKDNTFVGYSDPATQQTTCGNCHVLKQETWAKTGHAKAWANLQASGHASASCDQCHTVSGLTNIAKDSSGYFTVAADAKKYYQDVQCESCHGPGAAHVAVPDETQPIPYLVSKDTTLNVGCGMCHSGPPHNPFYEDWSRGAHGGMVAHAVANTNCWPCHNGKTAEARFGGSNTYVEASNSNPMPIGCTTCHNPHGSDNTNELRESITVRDTTNLCIQCHKREPFPDPSNKYGPHYPAGMVFLGDAGWFPPGFTWDSTNIPTHSDPSVNKTLCATCHLGQINVNNGAGKLAWHYTGHSFWAIPCVDTAGIDSTNSCDVSQRDFSACTGSGCHASQDAARALFESIGQEMSYLTNTLWVDSNGNGKVDTTDGGLLAKVPPTEFAADTIITTAEGALWNVQLVTKDKSQGVHNPPFEKALLIATIEAVQQRYGVAAPPAVQALIAREGSRLGVRIAR